MPIVMRLDRMLAQRKITSKELAARVGVSEVTVSCIKRGRVQGIRFAQLEAFCQVLRCKPGDLIDYVEPGRACSGGAPRPHASRMDGGPSRRVL